MATACIAQSTLRVHGNCKPIIARFDQPHASSDGGALLLKLVDDRLTLTAQVARALRDRRQPGKIAHSLCDLVRQRVFGLACGYADCNDAARLADDPIHKLLLDAIHSPARPWARNRRCRGSRTPSGVPTCIASAWPSPMRSWRSTGSGSATPSA